MPDMISRDEALRIVAAGGDVASAIRALPAAQVGVKPEESALEEQIEKLRNLCDCNCDDEDCVRCSHYPAILEQKKEELARIRSALTAQPSPDVVALVEAARNLAAWCNVTLYARHQDETLGTLLKAVDGAITRSTPKGEASE